MKKLLMFVLGGILAAVMPLIAETEIVGNIEWTYEQDWDWSTDRLLGVSVTGAQSTETETYTYTYWITDLALTDGTLSYSYDTTYYPEGTVWIALYSEDGQLLETVIPTEAGAAEVTVPDGTVSAKAFVVSVNNTPLDDAITATK